MPQEAREVTERPPVAYYKPRKHVSQMSPEERKELIHFARYKRILVKSSRHFMDRKKNRSISAKEALDTLSYGYPVEVSMSPTGPRALYRSESGICAVLGLKTLSIVTAYYNHPDDHHETLDKSQYTWDVDVVKLLKELA